LLNGNIVWGIFNYLRRGRPFYLGQVAFISLV